MEKKFIRSSDKLESSFQEKRKKDIETFFNSFAPDDSTAYETVPDGYKFEDHIDEMLSPYYSAAMCEYLNDNLNDIWSVFGGLEGSYHNFEGLKDKSKELYIKIDMLCSIIYINILNNHEDNLNKITDEISQHDNKLEKISSRVNNEEKNIIYKIKENVYSEFITILGIFTAITFAIFGGMNLLSNLFQNISSTPVSLGQTLILATTFSFIMWGIIELLFYWILKIKGITNGAKDKNKKYFNWIATGALALILILGILLFTKIIK